MSSLLRRYNYVSMRCYSRRCLISVASLLLISALAASNVYFTLPTPFPWPYYSCSRSSSKRGEACDIFRGQWVADPDAPYYTNETCSVIHEHYDCMKYGRPDLGFVKWRWRPDACELPRLDPARFLAAMRGKSIAFVGDSLARNHMQSLICLLTRVEKPTPNSPSDDGVYRYAKHNFTVANFWAPFLVRHEMVEDDGPAHTGLWNLHLDEPDAAWAPRVAGFDYVVVSASSWFYRPSMLYEAGRLVGCYYCQRPNVTHLALEYALRVATRTALRVLAADDGRGFRGTAVLRTVSPSQYEGGAWNKDGDCVRTRPYPRGEKILEGDELDFHKLQLEEFAAAEEAAKAAGGRVRMMLMDTTEAMILRADAHPSKYRGYTPEKHFHKYNDCVHWCMPGAVDAWSDMLLYMLTPELEAR